MNVLFVMDLQRDFLEPEGRLPIEASQADGVVAAMNVSIQRAACAKMPVIYVRNAYNLLDPSNLTRNFAAVRGSRGGELDPRVIRTPGATEILKTSPNPFSNGRLLKKLKDRNVHGVVVGGVYADACVKATCEAALASGFDVGVLTDAVGARSKPARDAAIADLRRRGAHLLTSIGAW
jgi:nicotinamidase-related amidase